MKKFKNRDRPQKIITAVAAVLVCILTVGFISATFSGSNGSPSTESGGIIEGSGSSSSDDVYLPTFETVNLQTFDERFTYTAGDDAVYKKGNVRLDKNVIKYGSVDTKTTSLKFSATENADFSRSDVSSILSFYLHSETSYESNVALLDMSKFDVLTLDFTIRTCDTDDIFPLFYFDFNPGHAFYSTMEDKIALRYDTDTGKPEFIPKFFGFSSGYYDEPKYIIQNSYGLCHCTFVIHTSRMGVPRYTFFVDGNRVYSSGFLEGSDLMTFCIMIEGQKITSSHSICIDDFQVCTYGNENVRYRGDLAGDISNLDITHCSDWIYYGFFKSNAAEGVNNETTE